MTTMLPIYTSIQKEKLTLEERSRISTELLNELHLVLHDKNEWERSFTKQIANRSANFTFSREDEYVKGCVNWTNAKDKHEERCLFGIPSQ